jgi:hypothetical protein
VAGSLATNVVTTEVSALVLASTALAVGDVKLEAVSTTRTLAAALAGSVAGAGGPIGGVTVTGAGALATNTIANTIEALITEGSSVTSTGGSVTLTAFQAPHDPDAGDHTGRFSVIAAAGELTAAGSGGAIGGVDVPLGAAFAENQILNTITASIDGATVEAAGDVVLWAISTATISAAAAGFSGSGSGGAIGGVEVSLVGSGTANAISNDVHASIENSPVIAGRSVYLFALDSSLIGAGAGGAAINGAGGAIGGVTIGSVPPSPST